MTDIPHQQYYQLEQHTALFRDRYPAFAAWAAGTGPITHDPITQMRVFEMAQLLVARDDVPDLDTVFQRLRAADRLACAGMWLVAHMTYARRVRLDGQPLVEDDFKPSPEGHTGGALNMVPAYIGYLTANALTGHTRGWMMGQGHCVAAIDACNLLVDNMGKAHASRYDLSDAGLTRLVQDFYAYTQNPDGTPASPLGSHVNAHTAGGLIEGGYLGFAELQYVHMPLPGERLVAFLSDGAFEEQRGSDWMPRWWRGDDSGLVTPVMIANGRRIDQRTSLGRPDGLDWFRQHLTLNGFAPVRIDGRDPAAFAWALIDAEERLQATAAAVREGRASLPVPLPYVIAETVKGWGFPGADTNAAHNLPLAGNPSRDAAAREAFNAGAAALFQPLEQLLAARDTLATHQSQHRPRERDNPLANRQVALPTLPAPVWEATGSTFSPMDAVDREFCAILDANPGLRPRVGNPDEMRSNRLNQTLDRLKHRVLAPEPGIAEALNGAVITALNEEAVVSAALANKGGINLVASYEAFAVKMLGAIRQELIFSRHQAEAGKPPGWLSVPVISSSHTWENGKNEQSHQDPTLAEALLGEMSDTSRVLFPVDANSASAALRACYASHGAIFNLVIPKRALPVRLDAHQAETAVQQGWVSVRRVGSDASALQLLAVGAYQLGECLTASARLEARGIAHEVICLLEPGRLRTGRDAREQRFCATDAERRRDFPAGATRILLAHTRPEPLLGLLWPLAVDSRAFHALGYINQGGTLNEAGMLFANRSTWAHALAALQVSLGLTLLDSAEQAAVEGRGDPLCLIK